MKTLLHAKKLPLLVAALGGIGLVLRRMLYAVAVDEKNLLAVNHPLEIGLWVLSAAVLGLIAAAVWKLEGSDRYEDNFRADLGAAIGHILAGCGILVTVLFSVSAMPGYLGSLWKLLGYAAPVCLILAGFARTQGKKPNFLLHLIPALFLMFHIVSNYRVWSSNPQFQDYIFEMLGSAALMFFAFYTAAFEADAGKRRQQLFMGLAAVYLCMVSLGATEHPILYLGGAVWALTGLCAMEPKPKTETPEEA